MNRNVRLGNHDKAGDAAAVFFIVCLAPDYIRRNYFVHVDLFGQGV